MKTGELFDFDSMPPVRPTREGLEAFLFHESRHGAEVLMVMGEQALAAKNPPFGSMTLICGCRFNVKGFTLSNDLGPFYAGALAIVRPELRAVMIVGEDFMKALRDAGWKPSPPAEGGARRD
jgi:hypothetical protein